MADHHHSHDHHDHGGACAHAHGRARSAADMMAAAEGTCAARGVRLTDIRRQVLAALLATHRPMGAYDLIDALAAQGQKRLAPVSIYRALDFLSEQGLIHKLASRNAFIACPHAHAPGEMVVFLICDHCGGVDETAPPVLVSADGLVAEGGYAWAPPLNGGFTVLELPSSEDAIAWAARLAKACRCAQELRVFGFDPES